jgi:uncharacterized protein YbaP (TraB family)
MMNFRMSLTRAGVKLAVMRLGLIALVTVISAGCAAAPTCPPHGPFQPRGPFVFDVSGHGATLTLVGSWHAVGKDDVPRAAWARLEQASIFVSELDGQTPEADEVRLPRGPGLDQQLSVDRWYTLVERLAGTITAERLARLKPWVAMSLLTARVSGAPNPSMDEALRARALALGLATQALETPADQVVALDQAMGLPALEQAIDDLPVMACRLAEDAAAYRAGDDRLAAPSPEDPAYPVMIERRNQAWWPALQALLAAGKPVFVVVGVGHVGGLLELLERHGYTVTRVAR